MDMDNNSSIVVDPGGNSDEDNFVLLEVSDEEFNSAMGSSSDENSLDENIKNNLNISERKAKSFDDNDDSEESGIHSEKCNLITKEVPLLFTRDDAENENFEIQTLDLDDALDLGPNALDNETSEKIEKDSDSSDSSSLSEDSCSDSEEEKEAEASDNSSNEESDQYESSSESDDGSDEITSESDTDDSDEVVSESDDSDNEVDTCSDDSEEAVVSDSDSDSDNSNGSSEFSNDGEESDDAGSDDGEDNDDKSGNYGDNAGVGENENDLSKSSSSSSSSSDEILEEEGVDITECKDNDNTMEYDSAISSPEEKIEKTAGSPNKSDSGEGSCSDEKSPDMEMCSPGEESEKSPIGSESFSPRDDGDKLSYAEEDISPESFKSNSPNSGEGSSPGSPQSPRSVHSQGSEMSDESQSPKSNERNDRSGSESPRSDKSSQSQKSGGSSSPVSGSGSSPESNKSGSSRESSPTQMQESLSLPSSPESNSTNGDRSPASSKSGSLSPQSAPNSPGTDGMKEMEKRNSSDEAETGSPLSGSPSSEEDTLKDSTSPEHDGSPAKGSPASNESLSPKSSDSKSGSESSGSPRSDDSPNCSGSGENEFPESDGSPESPKSNEGVESMKDVDIDEQQPPISPVYADNYVDSPNNVDPESEFLLGQEDTEGIVCSADDEIDSDDLVEADDEDSQGSDEAESDQWSDIESESESSEVEVESDESSESDNCDANEFSSDNWDSYDSDDSCDLEDFELGKTAAFSAHLEKVTEANIGEVITTSTLNVDNFEEEGKILLADDDSDNWEDVSSTSAESSDSEYKSKSEDDNADYSDMEVERIAHDLNEGESGEESSEELEQKDEDLEQNGEDLKQSGEDLKQNGEDLKQSGEDVEQNGEDLEQKSEELEQQSEELEQKSEELEHQREDLEQKIEDLEENREEEDWELIDYENNDTEEENSEHENDSNSEEIEEENSEESDAVIAETDSESSSDEVLVKAEIETVINSDNENSELMETTNNLEPSNKTSVEEFAQSKVKEYLMNAGYLNTENLNEEREKVIDTKDLAELISQEDNNFNSISLGPDYEPEEIKSEIKRFWKFYHDLRNTDSEIATELTPLLVPMLIYFYLELITNELSSMAEELYKLFGATFIKQGGDEEFINELTTLAEIKDLSEFETNENLQSLGDRKYSFDLSVNCYEKLKVFLAECQTPVLISLFSDRFVIKLKFPEVEQIRNQDATAEVEEDSEDPSDENYGMTCENDYIHPKDFDEDHFKRVSYTEQVIKRLRNNPVVNLPGVTVYTTNGRPLCGAISAHGTMVAYGMDPAGIRLCPTAKAEHNSDEQEDEGEEDEDKRSDDKENEGKENEDDENEFRIQPGITTINAHEGCVYDVVFHPKTKLMFSVGYDGFMRAWDLREEKPAHRCVYSGHLGAIWTMDISSSGSMISTGGMDTTARLWLPERQDYVRIFVGHYFDVDCVKFHPNEAYIATGSIDKSVRLWSINDGNMVRILTGCPGRVNAVAFHESGKYIAGGGEDDKIRIWDIAEGELLYELPSSRSCKDLSFYGNQLAGCFDRSIVQIWNLKKLIGGDDINAKREDDAHKFYDIFGYVMESSESTDDDDESESITIPAPFSVSCNTDYVFKVQFKDAANVFCLGAEPKPIPIDDEYDIENIPSLQSLEENSAYTFPVEQIGSPDSPSSPSIEESFPHVLHEFPFPDSDGHETVVETADGLPIRSERPITTYCVESIEAPNTMSADDVDTTEAETIRAEVETYDKLVLKTRKDDDTWMTDL